MEDNCGNYLKTQIVNLNNSKDLDLNKLIKLNKDNLNNVSVMNTDSCVNLKRIKEANKNLDFTTLKQNVTQTPRMISSFLEPFINEIKDNKNILPKIQNEKKEKRNKFIFKTENNFNLSTEAKSKENIIKSPRYLESTKFK